MIQEQRNGEKLKQIAVIVGPTACGKTALSIQVAKALEAEIVSADSVQVYQRLNIGSAKPDDREKQGIVHHMLDVVAPESSNFSVVEYQRMAFACIDDILSRGKLPLIVGGTGLYIHALTRPMDFTEAHSDETFRASWQQIEYHDPGAAHRALVPIDPQSAQRLHPNDSKRVIRALEVFHLTGKTLSEHSAENQRKTPPYDARIAGLTMPRDMLYSRIDQRVDQMVELGLVAEVEGLLASGCDPAATSMQGLGYKEMVEALQRTPKQSAERQEAIREALEAIKLGTRRFAKRQWTWFRRDERIKWFDVNEYATLEQASRDVIEYFQQM